MALAIVRLDTEYKSLAQLVYIQQIYCTQDKRPPSSQRL